MDHSHPSRGLILQLLRSAGGRTLADLQRDTGLSRSALRQHLILLERDGFVQERLLRGRTGRPPIFYQPTSAAEGSRPRAPGLYHHEVGGPSHG